MGSIFSRRKKVTISYEPPNYGTVYDSLLFRKSITSDFVPNSIPDLIDSKVNEKTLSKKIIEERLKWLNSKKEEWIKANPNCWHCNIEMASVKVAEKVLKMTHDEFLYESICKLNDKSFIIQLGFPFNKVPDNSKINYPSSVMSFIPPGGTIAIAYSVKQKD